MYCNFVITYITLIIYYCNFNIYEITDFQLISYDAVHNPAYNDAYVKSLISSVYRIGNGGYKVKPLDNINAKVTKNDSICLTASEFKDYTKQLVKIILENAQKNKLITRR